MARVEGAVVDVVPAQDQPRPARRRSASSWPPTVATTAVARDVAMHIAAFSPTRPDPRGDPGRDGRERAPGRRGHRARGGQARGGAAQDRRGSRQRLLQGERPARAAVRQGRQEDRRQGARGGRRQGHAASPASASAPERPAQHPDRYAGRARGPAPDRERGAAGAQAARVRPSPSPVEVSTDRRRPCPGGTVTHDAPHPTYQRVLLKLSGEVFGGGHVGLDPDVVRAIAAQIAEAVTDGRAGRGRHRRRQLLPRRRAAAARHGPRPRRLHGHARHRHELPGAAGLPGEGGHRHPRADRHHHGPGRRAVHPAPRDPAPGEGPRRHLRRRRRACRSSPPTPSRPSARWRSSATWS